jgi:osmoprotectant transport system permease protein
MMGASARPLFEWSWLASNLDRVGAAVLQHLVLTVTAVVIGLCLSSALAAWCLRHPTRYRRVIEASSLLYTVPSLALFALLAPIVGLGYINATIALVSYTLLILVRNIVTGILQVPGDVVEAAIGMGMTRRRVLWTIEVPLALPVIVAGVRIATVTVIGLVTVTALLGLGGLGQLILSGFRVLPPFPTLIVVGTGLSVVLAIAFDLILLGIQRLATPWQQA